ncbi:hypothetical protein D3C75_883470 [compost metagenome]
MADGQEQGDGRQRRFGQREDHPPVDREVIGPVQLGGFLQGVGQAVDEGADDEYIKCADETGEDIDTEGAHHMQVFDQNIDWNQSARDIHRQRQKRGDEPAGLKVHPA